MIFFKIVFLIFLSGCAGFYSLGKKVENIRPKINGKILIRIEMNYLRDGILIDEIGIRAEEVLNQRMVLLKNNIYKYLSDSNSGTLIYFEDYHESYDCMLDLFIREESTPRKMIPMALTLGVFPYIGENKIFMTSKLKKGLNIIDQSEVNNSYKIGFSLFFIPLAPFFPIKNAENESYEDTYKKSLGLLNFEGCSND